MQVDPRVLRRYEVDDEDERLWQPGRGDLLRMRTWDIFSRVLPGSGLVLDVGGGPGAHAAHLADDGYEVLTVDPLLRHSRKAADRSRAVPGTRLGVASAEARSLPVRDGAVDVVLLMGPLYHLIGHDQRIAALREARRCLQPGGLLLAEMITRHAWVLDAATKDILEEPGIWQQFEHSMTTGLSLDPATDTGGGFFAYFHAIDDFRNELAEGDFGEIELIAVEGFGWLLSDLEERMANPDALLRAIRLTEREPTMIGASAHVIATARRPNPPTSTSFGSRQEAVRSHRRRPSPQVGG
ncbi:MAG: class I SAM-dependent methyltransferase [Acidimicrobiales bacterium]